MNTGCISGKDQRVPRDPKSHRNVMNFHFYGGYYLPVSVPRRTSAFLMAWREPAQSKADAFPSKVRIENPCAKSCEQPTLEICQEICTHLWNLLTLHPDIFLQLATPPLFPRQVVISIRMPYHHYCYLFFSVQCFLLFFFFGLVFSFLFGLISALPLEDLSH